jgi:hypothetical protein
LGDDYTLPSELKVDNNGNVIVSEARVVADCIKIAMEIGNGLVQRGLKPTALFIASRVAIDVALAHPDDDSVQFPRLRTKVLRDDLGWTNHVVCEAGGIIYDPVLPEPLPHDDYLATMFEGEVNVSPLLII